jgi:hypothetical protein
VAKSHSNNDEQPDTHFVFAASLKIPLSGYQPRQHSHCADIFVGTE